MLVKSSFITKYIYTKIQITYKGSFFEASLKSFIIIILVNINTYKIKIYYSSSCIIFFSVGKAQNPDGKPLESRSRFTNAEKDEMQFPIK